MYSAVFQLKTVDYQVQSCCVILHTFIKILAVNHAMIFLSHIITLSQTGVKRISKLC